MNFAEAVDEVQLQNICPHPLVHEFMPKAIDEKNSKEISHGENQHDGKCLQRMPRDVRPGPRER
jgi:hypothetical protein